MKTVLIPYVILAFALTSPAWADHCLNVAVPGGGAQDMLNMTTIPSEVSDSNGDPTLQRSCTAPSGRVIHMGQPGYDECLQLARGKKPAAQPTANSDSGIVVHSQ
jgi:hypothetical protein